jgi:hypothetical protein
MRRLMSVLARLACETSVVQLFSFDRGSGHHIDRFGSDFVLSPLTNPDGMARVACFHLGVGGMVGEHEAVTGQLFCVVDGTGWVSGADGQRRSIATSQAAYWPKGERHAAGTERGLTAVVLEGDLFDVWATPVEADGS